MYLFIYAKLAMLFILISRSYRVNSEAVALKGRENEGEKKGKLLKQFKWYTMRTVLTMNII